LIPRANITAWRRQAPWSSDAQVEQDLVLSRAIVDIFSEPALAGALAFRGGTALHKLYLAPPERYSEDIDLVQTAAGPIGRVMDALRARLDPWLGRPRRGRAEDSVTLVYRFESETRPVTPLRLKVEVNTREHFALLGFTKAKLAVENPWFGGEADVTTYSIEELLGTKLRALYQRKKGRDLFDLVSALKRVPSLDASKVVECFRGYLSREGLSVSRAEFEANLAGKAGDPAFTGDVAPLLASSQGQRYDTREALEALRRSVVELLPGEPWKGHRRRPRRRT
jgi:predicted nucleotidyltransferase component of viral defense system